MVMWMTVRQHPCHIASAFLWAAGVREEGGGARPVAGAPTRRDPGAAGPQWSWCDLDTVHLVLLHLWQCLPPICRQVKPMCNSPLFEVAPMVIVASKGFLVQMP